MALKLTEFQDGGIEVGEQNLHPNDLLLYCRLEIEERLVRTRQGRSRRRTM